MTLELSQKSLALLFALSLIMGFCAGAAYDLVKFRRRLIHLKKIPEIIIMSLEDLGFFALWSVAFCILLYAVTFGVVRIEAIFLQFLGFFIYRKTLGILIQRLTNVLADYVRSAFSKLIVKTKKRKRISNRKENRKNERKR